MVRLELEPERVFDRARSVSTQLTTRRERKRGHTFGTCDEEASLAVGYRAECEVRLTQVVSGWKRRRGDQGREREEVGVGQPVHRAGRGESERQYRQS